MPTPWSCLTRHPAPAAAIVDYLLLLACNCLWPALPCTGIGLGSLTAYWKALHIQCATQETHLKTTALARCACGVIAAPHVEQYLRLELVRSQYTWPTSDVCHAGMEVTACCLVRRPGCQGASPPPANQVGLLLPLQVVHEASP